MRAEPLLEPAREALEVGRAREGAVVLFRWAEEPGGRRLAVELQHGRRHATPPSAREWSLV